MNKKLTKNILITGMPGSGKSFLTKSLRELGVNAFDADEIKGLGDWYSIQGKRKVRFKLNADVNWLNRHEYLWDKSFLRKFIHKNEPLILLGGSANLFSFVGLFDAVYYLKVPSRIIEKRIQRNNRKNKFGLLKEQRETVISEVKNSDKLISKMGITVLDGTLPPRKIISKIKF
jgi:shikimate kinase